MSMTLKKAQDKYRATLNNAKTEEAQQLAWHQYLADKHLIDGDTQIFVTVHRHAKFKYAKVKQAYYRGKITAKQYIIRRGIKAGKGISYYDYRLHQLGLGTQLFPQDLREKFNWMGLKLEREGLPPSMIPIDLIKDDTNRLIDLPVIQKTVLVMLEAFDTYNKLYVPSLKGQRFRDKRNIQRCETRKVDEDQYAQKTFPQIRLTNREIQIFRTLRDG